MSRERRQAPDARVFGVVGLVLAAVLLSVVWLGATSDSEPQVSQPSTTSRALGSDATTLAPDETTTALPATTTRRSEPAVYYDSESDRLVFESDLFSVRYPTDWVLATETLTSGLGWREISLGTFPLRPGTTDCPAIPENALEDMGSDDALVTLFVGGGSGEPPGSIFGPGFPAPSPDVFGFAPCIDRDDTLDLRWDENWDHGRPYYVLVAFGAEASDDTKQETYAILNGLALTWPGEVMAIAPRANPECDPPAPFDYRTDGAGVEMLLTPVPLAAWALVDTAPPFTAGEPVPLTISIGAAALEAMYFVHESGEVVSPRLTSAPSSWNPTGGTTWSTEVILPNGGCWEIRMVADGDSLTSWLEVR